MKNGSKISTKGLVIIGILVVSMVIIVFVVGRQSGEQNTIPQNAQNKSGSLSSNSTIQTGLPENKLTAEEKKKQEAQRKKPDTAVDLRNTTPNWLMTLGGLFGDYGMQFIALLVSMIGVILAISGFSLSNKKKQKFLKKYFHEIDDVYSAFKMKGERCEAELYRLQDLIEHELKEGRIDENTFQLLEKRIEKYLKEIKEQGKS